MSAKAKADTIVDFQCQVLGTNFWPFNPPATEFTIPREISPTFDRFVKFYNEAHSYVPLFSLRRTCTCANDPSGRKLTWLWHVSKNELKTTYLAQKYIFMTSAYQMSILTQFNESDTHTFKELQTATSIAEGILKPQLVVLVKMKVLLQDDDTYELNLSEFCLRIPWLWASKEPADQTDFKAKKIKVQLNQQIKSEQKQEHTETLAAVDEDRKFVYQATIVRLMKSRKVSCRVCTLMFRGVE